MSLDFLSHLRRESDRFLDVIAEADPSARVPSCPEWAVADLLWHLAEVQWFWATIVEERRTSPEGLESPPRPTDHDALLTFAAQQSDRLVRVLGETAPETEVYMWAEDKTVGYIRRRQAHEALIHRLDAELATEQVTPLDADLAADGVVEALGVMYGGCPAWGTFTGDGRRVAFRLTDRPEGRAPSSSDFVGTDPDNGTTYADEATSASSGRRRGDEAAVVTGTADDVDAWLWHRRGDDASTSRETTPSSMPSAASCVADHLIVDVSRLDLEVDTSVPHRPTVRVLVDGDETLRTDGEERNGPRACSTAAPWSRWSRRGASRSTAAAAATSAAATSPRSSPGRATS